MATRIEKELKNIAKKHGFKIITGTADDGKSIMALQSDFDLMVNIYHNTHYAKASITGRGIGKSRSVKYVFTDLELFNQRITKALKTAKQCKEKAYN